MSNQNSNFGEILIRTDNSSIHEGIELPKNIKKGLVAKEEAPGPMVENYY